MTPAEWIWINGEFRPGTAASVSPHDRGLHLGDGIYEAVLAVDGRMPHLEQHWNRLVESAALLAIPVVPSLEEIAAALAELLERNGHAQGRTRIRLTLTRGVSDGMPWDLDAPRPTLIAQTKPAGPPREGPFAVGILPGRRDASDVLWQHKTLNLLGRIMARADLLRRGLDDGLVVNIDGRLCEGLTSNLFAVLNGRVVTPPVTKGCLRGTVRARLLLALENQDWPVAEEPLTPAQLLSAEAAWLTSAVSPVQSIGSVDGHALTVTEHGRKTLAMVRELMAT